MHNYTSTVILSKAKHLNPSFTKVHVYDEILLASLSVALRMTVS